MPRQNAKARWAQDTLEAAIEAANAIMADVNKDGTATIDAYIQAGFHAATLLNSAVELVEYMETKP